MVAPPPLRPPRVQQQDRRELERQQELRQQQLADLGVEGDTEVSDLIQRIQTLAPYFKANGAYPVFLTWRTGPSETLAGILGSFSAIPGQVIITSPVAPATLPAGWSLVDTTTGAHRNVA